MQCLAALAAAGEVGEATQHCGGRSHNSNAVRWNVVPSLRRSGGPHTGTKHVYALAVSPASMPPRLLHHRCLCAATAAGCSRAMPILPRLPPVHQGVQGAKRTQCICTDLLMQAGHARMRLLCATCANLTQTSCLPSIHTSVPCCFVRHSLTYAHLPPVYPQPRTHSHAQGRTHTWHQRAACLGS